MTDPYAASSGYPPAAQPNAWANPAPPRNVPGLVAMWTGVAIILVGVVSSFVNVALPAIVAQQNLGIGDLNTRWFIPVGIVTAVLSLVAIGFGIAGMRDRSRPRAAAGAGLALGISALVSYVASMIAPLLIGAMM